MKTLLWIRRFPIVFTYKLFCKSYRNFSRAAEKKKIRKNVEEEFFCYRNICIINPVHRIVQGFLKEYLPLPLYHYHRLFILLQFLWPAVLSECCQCLKGVLPNLYSQMMGGLFLQMIKQYCS